MPGQPATVASRLLKDAYADNYDVCVDQPVTVTAIASDDRPSPRPLRVLTFGHPESPAVMSFPVAGTHTIPVTVDDGAGASETKLLQIEAHTCTDFSFVAIRMEALTRTDSYAFVATPLFARAGCAATDRACRARPEPGETFSYEWDLGDGSSATTTEPAIEHDYGVRPQTAPASTFVVHVKAISSLHRSAEGVSSFAVENLAFRNKTTFGLVTPIALVGRESPSSHGVDFPIDIRNYDAAAVKLEKATVDAVPCGEGTGNTESVSYTVPPSELLDETSLAPGSTQTQGHVHGNVADDRFCRVVITMDGHTSEGAAARMLFGVELRPDHVIELSGETAAQDPELAARLARVTQARALLSRPSGIVTEDEIRSLERRGLM